MSEEPSLNLYSGQPQHVNFARMKELFPLGTLKPAASPHPFPVGSSIELPDSFQFEGVTRPTEDFIHATDTSAILVLKHGEIRFERYALTGGPEVQWISWSVAKSFISALIGVAVDEGLISNIEDAIDGYVPDLIGSAYEGVRIKDILQMSSGARWNEDYSDPDSDINRFAAAITGGMGLNEFVAGMVRATEPGSLCQYNSADTQALGLLLVNATGRSVTDYMQEKLYEPLGMESPGYWLLDSKGLEMAFGGLNMTARDFAKMGELFRNGGNWQSQQLVPEAWVKASITPDAPHLQNGRGTHQGDYGGLPATGKSVEFTDVTICRIENGRIVEQSGLSDLLTLYVQLGLIELPGSA